MVPVCAYTDIVAIMITSDKHRCTILLYFTDFTPLFTLSTKSLVDDHIVK